MELASLEQPLPAPVELDQTREQDGPDRHIDTDPESVRAADDLEQPVLGELLDEPPVLREHPRMMDADTVADEPGEGAAKPGAEPETADPLGDRVPLLTR